MPQQPAGPAYRAAPRALTKRTYPSVRGCSCRSAAFLRPGLVQVVRKRFAERGPKGCRSASWITLRRILAGRQRVTATFKRADGRTLHVRKATLAEPRQRAILNALGIESSAGGTRKTIV